MHSEERHKSTYERFGMPRVTRKPMCVADPLTQRNAIQSAEEYQNLRNASRVERTYDIEIVYPAQISERPHIEGMERFLYLLAVASGPILPHCSSQTWVRLSKVLPDSDENSTL